MKKYIIITALSLCSNIWTMEHTKKDTKILQKTLTSLRNDCVDNTVDNINTLDTINKNSGFRIVDNKFIINTDQTLFVVNPDFKQQPINFKQQPAKL